MHKSVPKLDESEMMLEKIILAHCKSDVAVTNDKIIQKNIAMYCKV